MTTKNSVTTHIFKDVATCGSVRYALGLDYFHGEGVALRGPGPEWGDKFSLEAVRDVLKAALAEVEALIEPEKEDAPDEALVPDLLVVQAPPDGVVFDGRSYASERLLQVERLEGEYIFQVVLGSAVLGAGGVDSVVDDGVVVEVRRAPILLGSSAREAFQRVLDTIKAGNGHTLPLVEAK